MVPVVADMYSYLIVCAGQQLLAEIVQMVLMA